MHRMPAMAVKEEENRQQARERDRHVHRTAVREAQEQTQEMVSPVSRDTVRVVRIVLRAEDRRATVRKEEETATVTEEASKEEETAATVLAALESGPLRRSHARARGQIPFNISEAGR